MDDKELAELVRLPSHKYWSLKPLTSWQWISLPAAVEGVEDPGLAAEREPCTRIANLIENQLPALKKNHELSQEPIVILSGPEDGLRATEAPLDPTCANASPTAELSAKLINVEPEIAVPVLHFFEERWPELLSTST